MSKRTRVVLFAAAGVLAAVLATGLVAWAGGLGVLGSNGPDELAYVPEGMHAVVFANVRELMDSPFRDSFRQYESRSSGVAGGVEATTGIKFDTDIDRVLVASGIEPRTVIDPAPGVGAVSAGPSLVVARGRFDVVRIEALMRGRGAQVGEYRGKRVISFTGDGPTEALAFAEPGLLIFGPRDRVRGALDAKAGAAPGMSANSEFMSLVRDVQDGTAWSVAKFDSVSNASPIPSAVVSQLPPINWLAASGRVDTGLHAFIRAEAADEQSAQSLRDVVQGFLALARLQGGRDAAYKGMLDSVALNSTGKSVSLAFDVTPAALNSLGMPGAARSRH